MRHNRTQSEIGESFGVSQSTISRAISAIIPLAMLCGVAVVRRF
jgi:DNA-directed RNA polymerase specialized sigma subunit